MKFLEEEEIWFDDVKILESCEIYFACLMVMCEFKVRGTQLPKRNVSEWLVTKAKEQ